MELMDLLKLLVETDDKMERMSIVENNPLPENEVPETGNNDELVTSLETEIEALKQKYIDTFFNGGVEPKEDKPQLEEKPKQTLDELLGGL